MKCESIIYVTFQTRSQCMHKCTWTQRENKFSKILGFKFLPSHRVWVSTPCSGVKPLKGQGGRRGVLTPTPFISLPPTVPSLQLRDSRKSNFMYNNNFLFFRSGDRCFFTYLGKYPTLPIHICIFNQKAPIKKINSHVWRTCVCGGHIFLQAPGQFIQILFSLPILHPEKQI